MNLEGYRYELRHNEDILGCIRAGAIEEVSECACNDEAFFWAGFRELRRAVATGGFRSLPRLETPPQRHGMAHLYLAYSRQA